MRNVTHHHHYTRTHPMYTFEVENLLREKIPPKELVKLVMSFLKEDPVPWYWPVNPPPSPWDPLTTVNPNDGIDLPIFAP
jgi:hypothetical protein